MSSRALPLSAALSPVLMLLIERVWTYSRVLGAPAHAVASVAVGAVIAWALVATLGLWLYPRLLSTTEPVSRREAAWAWIWWLGGAVAAGLFRHEGHAVAIALGAGFLAGELSRPSQRDGWFLLAVVLSTTLVTSVCAWAGWLKFRHPELGNIAVWVPSLALHQGGVIRCMVRGVQETTQGSARAGT